MPAHHVAFLLRRCCLAPPSLSINEGAWKLKGVPAYFWKRHCMAKVLRVLYQTIWFTPNYVNLE